MSGGEEGVRSSQADSPVGNIALSTNGRHVAFTTASSLVADDTNHVMDVFRS